MDKETFDVIVNEIKLRKPDKENWVREPISMEEKVILCLRFLATGESFSSLCYGFLIAPNTCSVIVKEVCLLIIKILGPVHLRSPASANEWEQICVRFSNRWRFPSCLGTIDGKNVSIKKPPKSGSR